MVLTRGCGETVRDAGVKEPQLATLKDADHGESVPFPLGKEWVCSGQCLQVYTLDSFVHDINLIKTPAA